MKPQIIWFNQLGIKDIDVVGGKNASLGEMISNLSGLGIKVPDGFATTADAFRHFLKQQELDKKIAARLETLNTNDVAALVDTGSEIRQWILDTPFPDDFLTEVSAAFQKLQADDQNLAVAVRSSATAEDLPDASFAGQQETYLNVCGLDNVLTSIKKVFASLYNDRAISYRVHQDFDHGKVALSAGIQRMVRSDLGASGVLFTLDTESGFNDAIFITAAYGLGETVVQGAVNPDEFYVYKTGLQQKKPAILNRTLGSKLIKMIYSENTSHGDFVQTVDVDQQDRMRFCLNDDQVEELARYAITIEQHYARPMDIEWAQDGSDGHIYIVQARPETVESRASASVIERYVLKQSGKVLLEGRAIGQRIGAGPISLIKDPSKMSRVKDGDVLVTDMTDPDWEPIMKRASAIVTNRGGRTCHAAIIARELGIPAVVGCGNATELLSDGDDITVSCAEGDTGLIYQNLLDFEIIPLLLILAVLGSILGGLATPTEAASVGAVGAMLLAVARRRFNIKILRDVVRNTLEVSSMVFLILIGASVFSLVFRGFGGDELVEELLTQLPGGVFGAMLVVMLVMFLLGFVLDFIEITFVVVPIVGPILLAMGLDPVWLGIMIAINLQTSFLTPPFGFALFYLRGVAPDSVTTGDIYRGVMPFIGIQLVMLGLLAAWPVLATWLPGLVYGS